VVDASPFAWLSPRVQGWLAVALGAVVLVLSIVLGVVGAPLTTAEAPAGIVSFEFVQSGEHAARILGSWSPAAREAAALTLGLDFLYLVVYPAWLSLCCVLVARRLGGRAARVGVWIAWLVLAAALFDAVENIASIRILTAGPSDGLARVSRLSAAPKFALVSLASFYVLGGVGALLWRRARSV